MNRKVSEQLDSLMVQSIALLQGWACVENASTLTLWHSDRIAIDDLRSQIVDVDKTPAFDRWLGEITQQSLDIGSATHHFSVVLANVIAAAAIRGVCSRHMITQPGDINAFAARWHEKKWRNDYAETLRILNTSDNLPKDYRNRPTSDRHCSSAF